MATKNKKNGSNTTTATTSTESKRTTESKFTEEPQSNSNSSDSGQKYEIIGNTPFAAVKPEKTWKIILGNMIATPHEFESKEAAEEYVKEKPWELLWTMAVWVVNNQEKFKFIQKEGE